jgi:hypothetical protein
LGIHIRGDQIVNSKPLNAASASLDYVPFSGNAAAKQAQVKQWSGALAKTIGEDTDNVAIAVQRAEPRLSAEFDRVLRGNRVAYDDGLQRGLTRVLDEASTELTDQQFGVVVRQVNSLQRKLAADGAIDGQAAYNIKKGLDRIVSNAQKPNGDAALGHHAGEIRNELMDALNRSLGPREAAKFADTRRQYGNMIELRRNLPHGADVDITPAKLANIKTRSKDLNELADIAGQFLKGRMGDSGTAQRNAWTLGVPGLGVGVANGAIDLATAGGSTLAGLTLGRGASSAMNSNALRSYLVQGSDKLRALQGPANLLLPGAGALALPNVAN